MILVCSAAGLTGRAIIRGLGSKGHAVRALIHRTEQERVVREAGASEIVVGDLLDESAMKRAMRSVRAVYHVCPRMSHDEVLIGEIALAAARAEQVEHFVYHSAIHSQLPTLPHHWNKLQTETAVIESRLSYTILQPARYMQNVLAVWTSIVEQGVYPVPYSPRATMRLVDLTDISEAAGRIVANPVHYGAVYEVHGDDALSAEGEASILSMVLGQRVMAQRMSPEVWCSTAGESLKPGQIEMILKMFAYYESHGLEAGNANVLSWLLGRRPTTYREFVEGLVSAGG